MNDNEHKLMETELHEFETAEAEVNLAIENVECRFDITLSRRSKDIILVALRYFIEARKLYGED